ncbi:GreA/GreB family elongation factor [bacterium]|nr:GreA/GreB family elongation factor [bacterium]
MNGITAYADDLKRLKAFAKALHANRHSERAAALESRILALEAGLRPGAGAPAVPRARPGSLVSVRNLDTGESYSYRLVYPAFADGAGGSISVLSPLGSALIGRKRGERFQYHSPGGLVRAELVGLSDED